MLDVAILGAGPIGAATAQRLAERGRVRRILLVDALVDSASGMALDIQQSGPVFGFDTRLSAAADVLTAVGADVIVIADTLSDGEWLAERGLALVEQLLRAGAAAPIVFAGPAQFRLMEACYRELKMPARQLVGTGPSGLIGAVKSLAGVELNLSSVDVDVAGRPPAFVIGWLAATVSGALVRDRIPAHQLLAISNALPRLWPPGPRAIGSATAQVIEALLLGSRQLHSALTILDGELGARGAAVMLPLELGHGRVLGYVIPSLSPQERTALLNGLQA